MKKYKIVGVGSAFEKLLLRHFPHMLTHYSKDGGRCKAPLLIFQIAELFWFLKKREYGTYPRESELISLIKEIEDKNLRDEVASLLALTEEREIHIYSYPKNPDKTIEILLDFVKNN